MPLVELTDVHKTFPGGPAAARRSRPSAGST